MTRRAAPLAAALALALALGAGCGADQDPGLPADPDAGTSGPATTSRPLPPCPDGPDDTTPPAGCIGPDGAVLRP